MRRGEVWWVEDPDAGRRPHLVLTRDTAVDVLSVLIAVPATRTVRDLPTEVPLDTSDGMPDRCVLALDNVTLLPKSYFRDRMCVLGPERMASVRHALAIATGCGV